MTDFMSSIDYLPAPMARTTVKRTETYKNGKTSMEAASPFDGGLYLMVLMARGSSPLVENCHRRVGDLPDGDAGKATGDLESVLVTRLTALNNDA
ncbi:hypothetical protein [Brevibacterium siliguriense]|nr:hypothetical protein [Brevibacterium siliguriense]